MKNTIQLDNIVKFIPNLSIPGLYDVTLGNMEDLKKYSSVECHIFVYPYSRKVNSEHITFHPFQEYVKDISSHQRSVYQEIGNEYADNFGLLIGITIALVFAKFKPEDLFSVQSIISILGAYFIGKDLWDDVERFLTNISKNWRLRFQKRYYFYTHEKGSTLSNYSALAKERRLGKRTIAPEKIDFIRLSNSETIRMFFNMGDFRSFDAPMAQILSIQLDPTVWDEIKNAGFMLGVKLSLNRRTWWGGERCWELFQTLDKYQKGCLDNSGQWRENAVFFRDSFTLRRLKYFHKDGIIDNTILIEIQ